MLTPEVMSLFGIQRPRPRRFPFYGEKHVRSIQRDPLTGAANRDPADGGYWNTTNAAGTEKQCCCTSGTCKCKFEDGSGGFLGDTLIATFAGVTVPATCFHARKDVFGFGSGYITIASARYVDVPINGTFCLHQVGNSCVYTATTTGQLDFVLGQIAPDFGIVFADCPDCSAYSTDCTSFVATEIDITVELYWDPTIGIFPYRTSVNFIPPAFGSRYFASYLALLGYTSFPSIFFANQYITPPTATPLHCGESVAIDNQLQFYNGGMNFRDLCNCFDPPGTWPFSPPGVNPCGGSGCSPLGTPRPPGINVGGTLTLTDGDCT